MRHSYQIFNTLNTSDVVADEENEKPNSVTYMSWLFKYLIRLIIYTKYGIDRHPRQALLGNVRSLEIYDSVSLKILKICLVKFFRLLIQGFSQVE